MKKTDLAMIILIAAVSIIVSFFATNAILGSSSTKEESVKTIEKINANDLEPNPAVFNSNAINPTIEVQVGTQGQ
jgi:site-specific recombinase